MKYHSRASSTNVNGKRCDAPPVPPPSEGGSLMDMKAENDLFSAKKKKGEPAPPTAEPDEAA
jgi:hypothetical protein